MAKKGSAEIEESIPKLTYSPNNFQQWKGQNLVNAKSKFGLAARAVTLGKHLNVNLVAENNIPETEVAQRTEFDKESLKQNLAYIADKPKIVGNIVQHLSEDSAVRIRAFQPDPDEVAKADYSGPTRSYEAAFEDDDCVTIWKIIETTHLADPATLATKIATNRKALRELKQRNTPIEKYNEDFRFQVEKLARLGKRPDEEELAIDYLYSLNEKFIPLAKDMIKNSSDHPLPKEGGTPPKFRWTRISPQTSVHRRRNTQMSRHMWLNKTKPSLTERKTVTKRSHIKRMRSQLHKRLTQMQSKLRRQIRNFHVHFVSKETSRQITIRLKNAVVRKLQFAVQTTTRIVKSKLLT